MKKVALIIVVLAILGMGFYYFYIYRQMEEGEAQNFATWKEFIPRSGLFKVLLPNAPQYAKDFIPIPDSTQKRRYDMYASEKIDGTLFLISMITYPPEVDTSFDEDILHQNIKELIHNKPHNNLTKILNGTFGDYQTFDFTIESKEFHVEGKAIKVDKIVYMLTYITPKENFDPEEYQHFINSFHLLK